MSKLAEGFAITDIEALAHVISTTCPDLEIVRQKEFRTYTRAGDTHSQHYVLPGIYQLKLLAQLHADGVNVRELFASCGVALPEALADIEKTPWTAEAQNRLRTNRTFCDALTKFCKNVRNQDAEFVIRMKQNLSAARDSYEIGLIRHPDPQRDNEFVALTDTFSRGAAIFRAKGVGGLRGVHAGEEVWGAQLRRNYATCAAERAIQRQIDDPSSGVYAMEKVTLPDGSVRIEVLTK